ncbi:uncharacterized protein Tco025E_04597 [Trypanosoma conorhini]|uniref:Uncharacterized protein n=1 Tax=Trypanosoma conorhini TaxID=83891 RepID=A0A422PKF2_9TRYP|nr:uncharacterized protein Tco025E_04597 [Trypanosoma conorhini]RNF18212.1 hypothetical protein Tco025E_04597 [Trypanosoma conorhini]
MPSSLTACDNEEVEGEEGTSCMAILNSSSKMNPMTKEKKKTSQTAVVSHALLTASTHARTRVHAHRSKPRVLYRWQWRGVAGGVGVVTAAVLPVCRGGGLALGRRELCVCGSAMWGVRVGSASRTRRR